MDANQGDSKLTITVHKPVFGLPYTGSKGSQASSKEPHIIDVDVEAETGDNILQ